MSYFSIRVELHDAQWHHYTELAKDLARQGITDVIVSDDGVSYRLPPAEYSYVGDKSLDTIFNAAQTSANKTGKRNAVVVTEGTRRKWAGLEIISARRSA